MGHAAGEEVLDDMLASMNSGHFALLMRTSAVALVLMLVAGCGGGSSSEAADPAPAKTSAAPRAYAIEDLASGLPRSSQVPTATKKTTTCPGDKFCRKGAVSVAFELEAPGDPAEVQKRKDAAFVLDRASVSANVESDPQGATVAVEKDRRTEVSMFDGPFDIKLRSKGKTYNPGQKGTGAVEALDMDGWRGWTSVRTQKYSGLDNGTIGFNSTIYDITVIKLAARDAVLRIDVIVASKQRPKGESSTIALRLARDYIKRLG